MNTVEHNIYGRGTVYCYSYRYGTVCSYCMLVQYQYEYELQYSTTTERRRRPSLHQASVKKGGPRGVSPLVRSGGGLKNRRFPPPHPSDDNVLYSIFAPCPVRVLVQYPGRLQDHLLRMPTRAHAVTRPSKWVRSPNLTRNDGVGTSRFCLPLVIISEFRLRNAYAQVCDPHSMGIVSSYFVG